MESSTREILIFWVSAAFAAPLPAPVVAHQEERAKRAHRSAVRLLVAAVAEMGAGSVVAVLLPDQREAGLAFAAGGLGHGLTAVGTLDLTGRRQRSFDGRVLWATDHPDSWVDVGSAAIFSVERDARANAYGAGLWSGVGVSGAGAFLFAVDDADQWVGGALALSGLVGTVHHATRWGASTRLVWEMERGATP